MQKDLFQRIEEAEKPDFSDILSKSIELFKKVWEQALYHVLITMALILPMMIIVYIPLLVMMNMYGGLDGYGNHSVNDYIGHSSEPPVIFIIIYAIVMFMVIFIIQCVSFGIIAHFFKVCKKEDTGKPVEVGGYFVYLKGENLKKVFLLSIATVLISIAAALLCYFPVFYVIVPLHLMQVVFAFNDKLSVSDIIRASFKLGNKFWLITFGLMILSSILAQVGILLCFIGIIFTAYFVHIPMYYLYKDTVGFDDENKEIIF